LDGNHGRGVTVDVADADALKVAYTRAYEVANQVIVERRLIGRDYRVLVVNGEVVAVAERVPAQIIGDSIHSVGELIEEANRDPRRGNGHENAMTRIKVDEAMLALLAQAGLGLDSIPRIGQAVRLRDTANLSTGGTAVDQTDRIHPEN